VAVKPEAAAHANNRIVVKVLRTALADDSMTIR
jgi:hypothetical protein